MPLEELLQSLVKGTPGKPEYPLNGKIDHVIMREKGRVRDQRQRSRDR